MKVALVHDWLTGMRGGEKCLEVLCRHFPDAELYTLLYVPGSTSETIERRLIHTSPLQHIPVIRRHYRYWLPLMPWAMRRLHIPGDVDLVVSFSHAVAKSIRVPRGVPHVCYCFTPMRYVWHRREDYFASDGQKPGLKQRFLGPIRDRLLDRIRDWDRRTADGVTHFISISRTIERRIQECYGRESHLIYPPVDTTFYCPALSNTTANHESFYLYVGALAPYKRVDLAIEACNRLERPLVVVGSGQAEAKLRAMAGPTVEMLGWQSDETIRDRMRHARALLFPANEDFGIVPLEAQACGTSVIAYGEGGATETILGLEEVPDGPTGLFFREQTVDSFCNAIERFEASLDRFSPAAARRQAERFDQVRFEQELLNYLDKIVK
ncbi:MAG: glycosyltransferase [Planctomycetia bacterium]|jgi:glycosyltransferase involved in cell wall biosynthesis